jgi:hypothetical protein
VDVHKVLRPQAEQADGASDGSATADDALGTPA